MAIRGSVTFNDARLQRRIAQMAAAKGTTIKAETRVSFKSRIRDALLYTPPGSSRNLGATRARQAGEQAINRDLQRMGFVPVKIKGKRVYKTTFWGHKLKHPPLVIPTSVNPKFADPQGWHRNRLANKHGKVTRGGRQLFYVDQALFKALRDRLILAVGRLAAGWVNAANELGVPVPQFISRHAEAYSRGTRVQITETEKKLIMRVVNRFPESTEKDGLAADMVRRLAFLKKAAIGRLERQLEAKLKGLWKKSR